MNTPVRLQILRHLAKGHSLTPLTALTKFGCLSLSQRCGELRKQGWPVISEMETRNGKKFARYRINRAERARL
jgi:hypothetical protein